MKKIFTSILLFGASLSLMAENVNLLLNPGFEEYTTGSFLGVPKVEFDDWFSINSTYLTVETTDVMSGEAAFRTTEVKVNSHLYQSVNLAEYEYPEGQTFELVVNYKIFAETTVTDSLACFWASSSDGNLSHDADVLCQPLENTVSENWKTLRVITTKPAGATKFEFYMAIPKKSAIMLDDLSFSAKDVPSAVSEVAAQPVARKQYINGQLVIEHNGAKFNAQGQVIY